jgi:hypothetical protein
MRLTNGRDKLWSYIQIPTLIPDEITTTTWRLSAEHMLRGQKDPTTMVAEAIRNERPRCLSTQLNFAVLNLRCSASYPVALSKRQQTSDDS